MMQGCSNKYLDLQVNKSFFPLSLSLLISFSVKVCFIARSLTKIGHASMNQALMVLATKSCSLLFAYILGLFLNQSLMIVATKSCSNLLPIEFL